MNNKRFRLVLLAVFAAAVLAFGGICYLGLGLLNQKSAEMVDLKLKNKTADAQLSNLESSKKDISKYSYFKEVAQSVIPNDKDQAQAVLEIFQIAQSSGIGIQSVNFPSSNLGAKTTTVTPGSTSTSVSAAATNAISQAQPVGGIPGLYSVQLTIIPNSDAALPPSQQITYAKMLNFLSKIENNRRTAQITQVSIQPSLGQTLNFSLTVNIFIKP
jgi:hypothetical protein